MEKETQVGLSEFQLATWLMERNGFNLFEAAIVLQQLEFGNGLGSALLYVFDLKQDAGRKNEEDSSSCGDCITT